MTVRRRPPLRLIVGDRCLGWAAAVAIGGWTGPTSGAELPAADCVVTPYATVDVSSAAPGVLESVDVDRSDRVESGQVVARLASGVERSDLDIARARAGMDTDVHLWEVTLDFDRQNRERLTSLHDRRAASAQDREKAERDAALSSWKLRRARDVHELRQLELNRALEVLEQKTIRSPISGVVARRFKSPGEYVEDHPVVRIVQLDPLHVEAIVPMEYFGRIAEEMPADVFFETRGGDSNRAKVAAVDRMGDAASGTFGVRLELPNPEHRLPAGVKCSVQFLPLEQMADSAQDRGAHAGGATPPVEGAHGPRTGARPGPVATAFVDPASGQESAPATVPSPAVDLTHDISSGVQPEPIAADSVDAESDHESARDMAPLPIVARADDPELGMQTEPVTAAVLDPLDSMSSRPSARTPSPDCRMVGPLADEDQVERVRLVLTAHGYEAERQEVIARKLVGYMVLTPEQPTGDELRALEGRLMRGGVDDLFAYTRGGLSGRISVGLYSERQRAEERLRQLETLGFETEVREHTRARPQWWLSLEPPPADIDAATLRFALEQVRLDFGDGPIGCKAAPDLLASN